MQCMMNVQSWLSSQMKKSENLHVLEWCMLHMECWKSETIIPNWPNRSKSAWIWFWMIKIIGLFLTLSGKIVSIDWAKHEVEKLLKCCSVANGRTFGYLGKMPNSNFNKWNCTMWNKCIECCQKVYCIQDRINQGS